MTRRLVAVYVLVLAVVACSKPAHEKALSYSLGALNAAREGFIAWDAAHQETLAESGTVEEAEAALRAYRKEREKVLLGFVVAYQALAAASLDPSLDMLAEAAQAVRTAYDLFRTLKGGDSDERPGDPEGGGGGSAPGG